MIKIYGRTRSRASRNIWFCKEAGLEYEQIPVIQAYALPDPHAPDAPLNTKSPAFLKINPNGLIPALVDGDLILNESLAINLYLARKLGAPLGGKTIAEEGEMAMWSLWAAIECEGHTINVMYHTVSKPVAERDPKVLAAAVAALRKPLGVLEGVLAKGDYLVGNRFTVADINVVEVLRYALTEKELFAAFPRVDAWVKRCRTRPGHQAMWAIREAEPA